MLWLNGPALVKLFVFSRQLKGVVSTGRFIAQTLKQ